jgi:hypothetical protein
MNTCPICKETNGHTLSCPTRWYVAPEPEPEPEPKPEPFVRDPESWQAVAAEGRKWQ